MLFLKLFHVFALFVWIGMLLALSHFLIYLPKVIHTEQQTFLKIARRMYFFIDLPAMVIAVALGLLVLIFKKIDFKHGWLHMKLTFAFLLIVCDVYMGRLIAQDRIFSRPRLYKILHLTIVIVLIGILFSIYVLKKLPIL